MNLKGYLKTRGVLANALFKKEAAMLNLPWPLPRGWVSIYGDIEISKDAEERLRNFLRNKGRSHQDLFQQEDKPDYLALLKQLEASKNQVERTMRVSNFAHQSAQQIAKNIQAELEARIRAELMKHAERIVVEVAREIAKNIKSNLAGYGHIGDDIILHLRIDGVEKGVL